MIPRKRLQLLAALVVVGVAALWPADAAAQRRGGRRAPVRTVIVGAYGGPIAPYYYDPFFSGWYGYGQYPPYARYAYQPAADMRIQVTPREAEVYLDGYLVGTVDQYDGIFQRLHVPFGEHTISIYRDGYRTITERMLFRPYESYHLKQVMEPVGSGGTPDPRPEPAPRAAQGPGAYPDPRAPQDPRAYPDPTPASRPPSRRGNRDTVQRGDRFGALAIRVQPRDAVVMVDDERWDAPAGEDRLLVELAEGPHRVEIRKDRFRTYTSTVRIQAGETATLNVSLPADR